jgi:hypothetical protein
MDLDSIEGGHTTDIPVSLLREAPALVLSADVDQA